VTHAYFVSSRHHVILLVDRLDQLQTPLLLVSAQDDPVLGIDTMATVAEAAANNPMLIVSITECGGHVAWPEGWKPWTTQFAYMSDQALEFAYAVQGLINEKKL